MHRFRVRWQQGSRSGGWRAPVSAREEAQLLARLAAIGTVLVLLNFARGREDAWALALLLLIGIAIPGVWTFIRWRRERR